MLGDGASLAPGDSRAHLRAAEVVRPLLLTSKLSSFRGCRICWRYGKEAYDSRDLDNQPAVREPSSLPFIILLAAFLGLA